MALVPTLVLGHVPFLFFVFCLPGRSQNGNCDRSDGRRLGLFCGDGFRRIRCVVSFGGASLKTPPALAHAR